MSAAISKAREYGKALSDGEIDYRAYKKAMDALCSKSLALATVWNVAKFQVRNSLSQWRKVKSCSRSEAKAFAWRRLAAQLAFSSMPVHSREWMQALYKALHAESGHIALRFIREGKWIKISYCKEGEWQQFGDALPFGDFAMHDVFHFALRQETGWSPVLDFFLEGADVNKTRMKVLREEALVIAWVDGLHDPKALKVTSGADLDPDDVVAALKLGDAVYKRVISDLKATGRAEAAFVFGGA
jgi:hypothetical protein